MEPWQAKASEFHTYLVASMDELPTDLRSRVKAALPQDTVLASGLVVPANYRADTPDGEPHPVPAQVLIFTGEGMWHIEAPDSGPQAPAPIYIDPDTIRWIRSSHLLLHGRLEIAAAERSGPVQLDIEFNAVGWRQRDQNWRNLVARSVGLPPMTDATAPTPGAQDRAILGNTPEKFVDGVFRYGLYTGETLQAAIFQPALWQHHLIAGDEQIAPDTLVALTNCSVLILSEEKALVRHSDEFGLLVTRLPRRAIAGVQVEAGAALDPVIFALSRAGVNDAYRIFLAHDAAQSWRAIWTQG